MKTHTVTLQDLESGFAEPQEILLCGQWGTIQDKRVSKELVARVHVLDSGNGPQYIVKHFNEIVLITWDLGGAIERYNSL